jgi:uncharacterized protein YbaP (TraB family)
MVKSIFHIQNLFSAVFVGLFCLFGISQQYDPDNQLLWQITGKGLKKPSYLFGSYHSNDTRLFEFSDSTFSAILNAEAIVLEADIYSLFTLYDSRDEKIQLEIDANGKPYTSNKKASSTKYGNENGRPQFLDAYFQQIAYNSGKKFFPLESVQSQMDAYENITYHNYKEFSISTLSLSEENILQTYLSGDIETMRQSLKAQLAVSANAYNLLITNRNVLMAKGIDSLCRKHSLFVAVGAAHLAGKEGIIQLLKNKGYTVRQVGATFSDKPTKSEITLRKFNTYLYSDTAHHFSAVFGGMPKADTTAKNFKIVYQEMGQGNTYIIEVLPIDNSVVLSDKVDDLFYTSQASNIQEIIISNDIQAFEGIANIYGLGDCWRRVFIYKDQLFKLTCYGGNKFMNSDRYKKFFDRVVTF